MPRLLMRFRIFKGKATAFALAALMLGVTAAVPRTAAWAEECADLFAQGGLTPTALQAQDSRAGANNPVKPSASQLKAFKKTSANFSLDLFNRCVAAKSSNKNVVIAPMSVMYALSLTANGAVGGTQKQMRQVLAGGAPLKTLNANLTWYNKKLTHAKKAKVNNANGIWYHNSGSLKMKKVFLSVAKSSYGAEVEGADFSSQDTIDSINAWVSKQTNGMINKAVDDLDSRDRIAIVNALSFDAEWAVPYEKASVHKAAFTNAKGVKRKVDMMYGTEHTYIKGKGVTGFIKPYAKGYRYVALLPSKGVSLKGFVKSLTGDKFRELIANAANATVRTALPKYSISYGNEDMAKQLTAMGLGSVFSSSANFSKMATDTSGNLSLGSVSHKARIDLDEKGTKAAAVTTAISHATSLPSQNEKKVYLNRPFVYAIVDNTTNLPVFIGTVNNIS